MMQVIQLVENLVLCGFFTGIFAICWLVIIKLSRQIYQALMSSWRY